MKIISSETKDDNSIKVKFDRNFEQIKFVKMECVGQGNMDCEEMEIKYSKPKDIINLFLNNSRMIVILIKEIDNKQVLFSYYIEEQKQNNEEVKIKQEENKVEAEQNKSVTPTRIITPKAARVTWTDEFGNVHKENIPLEKPKDKVVQEQVVQEQVVQEQVVQEVVQEQVQEQVDQSILLGHGLSILLKTQTTQAQTINKQLINKQLIYCPIKNQNIFANVTKK